MTVSDVWPGDSNVMTPEAPAAGPRLLLPPPGESPALRWLALTAAILLAGGFLLFVLNYFAPAPGNPGIDENAYLVAGKNLAHHLTPGMRPATPFAYVGPMWIRAESGWFYPKYPPGTSLLNALAITLAGRNDAAFYVNPVCAALAVLGMFFLTRGLAGSPAGLLAAVLLAANPTVLQLALVPSSHAPALCFAVWGMFALTAWWRGGGIVAGVLAGLLLGYAVMVRYTEGLLILPAAAVALSTVRWRQWRTMARAAVPLLAWAVVTAALVGFNLAATGQITGYDSTRESTGFTFTELARKWDYTIEQLHQGGLFFLLPLGVLGILLLLARRFRAGLFLTLWFVPSLLVYMAYYWGMNLPGVSFLRFFLTLYPAVIAAAAWALVEIVRPAGRAAQVLIPAGFVLAIAAFNVQQVLPELKRAYVANANLAFSARRLLDQVPQTRRPDPGKEPVLFAEDGGFGGGLIMYLQFMAEGEWYTTQAFTPQGGGRGMLGRIGRRPGAADTGDNDNPVLIQPQRIADTQALYAKLSRADLAAEEKRLLASAIDSGRGAFAVLSSAQAEEFRKRLANAGFVGVVLDTWSEPLQTPASLRGGRGGFGGFGPPGGNVRGRGGRGNEPPGPPDGRGGRPDSGPRTLQLLAIQRAAAWDAPATQPQTP